MIREDFTKYPRTSHHPASPGATSDDKRARDLGAFEGETVWVTEKMDGENTTLYRGGFHARSLDSGAHPARARVAALWGEIGYRIPEGWRVCGENLYARHAIAYDDLEDHFLAFSVWDDTNTALSKEETCAFCDDLGVALVPTLFEGVYRAGLVEDIASDLDPRHQEGLVMRVARRFSFDAFSSAVVKWVRQGHVQPDGPHWSKGPIVPNGVRA